MQNPFRRVRDFFRRPAMIGTPPSQRPLWHDPAEHARKFANEYADRLENHVEGRMHALGIPGDQMGLPDLSRGKPWAVFHPSGMTGGSVIGERFAVDSGVLDPELLTERYEPEVREIWARSRLRDRIDAVIAHEMAESRTGTHEGAEALAADTDLPGLLARHHLESRPEEGPPQRPQRTQRGRAGPGTRGDPWGRDASRQAGRDGARRRA